MALFCALLVALCSTLVAAQRATASSEMGPAPDIAVKEFYEWYIHSVSHHIDPFKAGKTTLKKYVTLRFILKIETSEGYDGDYFLEAQGTYPDSPALEEEWKKNISVSNVAVRGTTATAVISFGDNGKLARERISLIQEGGVWKIDNVKAIYPRPLSKSRAGLRDSRALLRGAAYRVSEIVRA